MWWSPSIVLYQRYKGPSPERRTVFCRKLLPFLTQSERLDQMDGVSALATMVTCIVGGFGVGGVALWGLTKLIDRRDDAGEQASVLFFFPQGQYDYLTC